VAIGAGGAPEPLHYREKMRIKGPSVRRDLGKQAQLAQAGEPR
jgi:sulfite reductase (NADPH) hemoprotein beta-component